LTTDVDLVVADNTTRDELSDGSENVRSKLIEIARRVEVIEETKQRG